MSRPAILVLGNRRHLDDTTAATPNDTFVAVPMPAEVHTPTCYAGTTSNAVILSWDSSAAVKPVTIVGGQSSLTREVTWRDLYAWHLPGEAFVESLRGLRAPDAAELTPLYVLTETESGVHGWVRVRTDLDQTLFVRVTENPALGSIDQDLAAVVAEVRAAHRQHSLFLNNHQCYYRTMFDGEEIEHKYVLDPETDIWGSTVRLYRSLREGAVPGFAMEFGDEFQTWDYLNHLYDVPAPPTEQGYISFIPLSTGGYTVKRKWFAEDSVRRGERHYKELGEVTDRRAYLKDRFGVEVHKLPSFRRVRYDVNIESLRTGHLYGIYFDHSRLVDHPEIALVQCELEYIRTRSVLVTDEADVFDELEQLAQWLEGFLASEGLCTTRGTYSKLSFLRDAVRQIDRR